MLGYLQVGDLGYASELGNYAKYSGAPNEEEVLQYARVVIDVSIKYLVNVIGYTIIVNMLWHFLGIFV